jgi:signal transduction histidine kinase
MAELDPSSLDSRQAAAMTLDVAELEQLVEDILITARLEASTRIIQGLPPLKLSRVSSEHVLREAIERFRSGHADRKLDAQIASALPEVEADAVLLRRVVDNILDNASKYSDANEPIKLIARAESGSLHIEVRDRGIGMNQADVEKLFTPFFRTDRSRARGTGGVGLGLALARRIVEAHRGQLMVESMVGLGTVVRLTLPAAPAAPADS